MLPLIALGASTALSAYSSYMQGEAAREDARAQAQNELFRAIETRYRTQENIKLREKQTKQLLGQQQVAYAASGVDVTSGAPLTTYSSTISSMLEDNLRDMRAMEFDNIQSSKSIAAMQARGQAAYTAGILGAGSSVMSGAYQYSRSSSA